MFPGGALMPDRPSPEVELLRAAYAAFNARDIDAALATMAPEVLWPRAFKDGFGGGRVLVGVHQVVRDRAGAVLADGHVGHRFTIESGLIRAMEVCSPPPGSV